MTVTVLDANAGDSSATTLTTGAADTKSAYVEVVASAAEAYDSFFVKFSMIETLSDAVIDIALGAAASEVDLVNDFLVEGIRQCGVSYAWFPIPIPAGSRVSARMATARVAGSMEISVIGMVNTSLSRCALQGTSGLDTMGFNSGDTGGIQIDPGGTINTKGAYSQIVASTAHAYKYLGIAIGSQDNITQTQAEYLIDVAVGGAGAESDIFSNLQMTASAGLDGHTPAYRFLPCENLIGSSARLSVRAQSSTNDATDRLFDVILYGFYGDLPATGAVSINMAQIFPTRGMLPSGSVIK